MKKLIFFASIFILLSGCERNVIPAPEKIDIEYTVKVVAYDPNCNTCIVEFPYYLSNVSEEIGKSPDNLYQTINLSQDNYKIGEQLRIRLRKPALNELTPCKTLFASDNHPGIFVTESEKFNDIVYNDTIDLGYRKCVYIPDNQSYLCLDSIVRDSRCPEGMLCFIAGDAEVRLKYEKLNSEPVFFNLRTPSFNPLFTVIDGYKITLLDLKPYPSFAARKEQKPYSVVLIVKKINKGI